MVRSQRLVCQRSGVQVAGPAVSGAVLEVPSRLQGVEEELAVVPELAVVERSAEELGFALELGAPLERLDEDPVPVVELERSAEELEPSAPELRMPPEEFCVPEEFTAPEEPKAVALRVQPRQSSLRGSIAQRESCWVAGKLFQSSTVHAL